MSTTRIKQLLMGIGLLTVLGTLALFSLVAYLWWDAGRQAADIDTDADVETASADSGVEAATDPVE
jgi:hypothetical protein